MSRPGTGYEGEAGRQLAARYETVDPVVLHQQLVKHLPSALATILDIGAGSGRDAAWFAALEHTVLAVEPAGTIREEGQSRHPDPRITWLADGLPGCDAVFRIGAAFDVILLPAVWMHVAPTDRPRAFPQTGDAAEARRTAAQTG